MKYDNLEDKFVQNAKEYIKEHGEELGIKTEEDKELILKLAHKAGVAKRREKREQRKEEEECG